MRHTWPPDSDVAQKQVVYKLFMHIVLFTKNLYLLQWENCFRCKISPVIIYIYFLSIRYILILSCSVVSYERKKRKALKKRKRKKREKKKENTPPYVMQLIKNSIVPLVHFVILYTLNFVRYSLGYCIYIFRYLSVLLCIFFRVDFCDDLIGMWFQII